MKANFPASQCDHPRRLKKHHLFQTVYDFPYHVKAEKPVKEIISSRWLPIIFLRKNREFGGKFWLSWLALALR